MSVVFFAEADKEFLKSFRKEAGRLFSGGDTIAIKLHMGETGGKYFLKPAFVKKIVDILRELGTMPFLFDSPVRYKSRRHTVKGYYEVAKENGFTEKFLGCPVRISEDFVTVKEPHLEVQVCKELAQADGVLVLSHVKGHSCSGFGAAIKNLGMGALTKKSKGDVHEGGKPNVVGLCAHCGRCRIVCPQGAITYRDDAPEFDLEKCVGCSKCIEVCGSRAIQPVVERFDTLLAEGADAAVKTFKKAYYVNVLRDISQFCDCTSRENEIVLGDIGILMGRDIVAVDKASHDMIMKNAGKDLFREINHKSPLAQIEETQKLGMGRMEYTLKRI